MKKQRSKNNLGLPEAWGGWWRRFHSRRGCVIISRGLWHGIWLTQANAVLHCLQTCWSESQTSPWNIPRGRSESYDNSQRTHYYPFLICHQTLPFSSQLPNSLRNEWKHLKSILTGFLLPGRRKVNPTCHDIEWRSTLFWRSRAWNIQRVIFLPIYHPNHPHTSLGNIEIFLFHQASETKSLEVFKNKISAGVYWKLSIRIQILMVLCFEEIWKITNSSWSSATQWITIRDAGLHQFWMNLLNLLQDDNATPVFWIFFGDLGCSKSPSCKPRPHSIPFLH